MNHKQQTEHDRCYQMGRTAARMNSDVEKCPFHEGGRTVNLADKNEPPRHVLTVHYMRDGWLKGFYHAQSEMLREDARPRSVRRK